jgi:hypothetical protein
MLRSATLSVRSIPLSQVRQDAEEPAHQGQAPRRGWARPVRSPGCAVCAAVARPARGCLGGDVRARGIDAEGELELAGFFAGAEGARMNTASLAPTKTTRPCAMLGW